MQIFRSYSTNLNLLGHLYFVIAIKRTSQTWDSPSQNYATLPFVPTMIAGIQNRCEIHKKTWLWILEKQVKNKKCSEELNNKQSCPRR